MNFSFFILYLFQICSFQIMENEISLYPTVGEYYEYNIYELIYEDEYVLYQTVQQNHDLQQINKILDYNYQLKWINHPDIENIEIKNQFQEIDFTIGNQFKSLSSNTTHFVGLTFENEVKIYKWENQLMRQIGQSLNIDNQFNCFNIDISSNNRILVDCYQNEQFYLMNISDSQYNIVNSYQSSVPIKTKLQSIFNGTNTQIIYAQYYQNYSILSLFSNQYENLTCWNNNFVDFDIPIKIDPYIYVLTQQQILQFSISSDYTFELQSNFTQDNITNFITIHSYYNYFTYSQCDQILVQYQSEFGESFTITSLWGCEKQIILQNNYNQYQFDQSIQTILQNNQFIIFQQNHQIILYQQGKSTVFQYNHIIQINSLLYFNADNELFSFNQIINTYKIQNPSLQINLTSLQVAGQNDNFSIMCFSQKMSQNQNLIKINLLILPKNDTNIYVMFQQNFPQYQYTMLKEITINFFSFSGKFLQYQQNNDTNYFNFVQATYKNISSQINQNFNLVQQLQTIQNFNETQLFLIGYNNQQVYIYNCSYYHWNGSLQNITSKDFLQYTTFNNISISVNANSLQVAYSIQPEIIIIGLSDKQTICLIQQQYDDNKTFSQSNTTFESEILDFVVTYNNIIILFINQEIQIMTLDFQNIFTLNQTYINKYFNNTNIEFNPIQIIMNTQLLSSFLYINNIQNVIIISIQQNSFIPISLIQVNFTIKQINLVNQQLILSYICYNNQSICFQVLNVQNLPQYYYEKNLCEVDNDDQISIQSDNLFFYVTFANNTVYIYNPQLPYHMNLYYQLNKRFQSTLAIQNQQSFLFDYSIIFQQNTFYQLTQLQTITILPNQNILIFNYSYPQVIYNYNVTSVLNNSTNQSTTNQSITYLSDFIQFQPNKTITINLTSAYQDNRNHHFSYPLNLIVDRQYAYCTINDLSHLTIIDLKFLNNLLTQGCLQTSYKSTYDNNITHAIFNINSLITSINNQFIILQNNTLIYIYDSNLTYIKQQKQNFSQCLASTSYNYTQYSICENSTSQYLIKLTLSSSGSIVNPNTTIQLPNIFSKIIKIRCVLDQIFILGSLNNQNEFLYWFNQYNNSFIQLTKEINHISDNKYYCQDFSAAQFQQTYDYEQQYTIIIFQTIRYQLFYQIMEVEGENVRIKHLIYVIIHYCNFQYSCFQLDKFKYILIINQIQRNVIILLTDKYNFSYFIRVIINPNIHSSNNAATVIRTIPNYYLFNCTGNSIYFDGILMQQFKLGSLYLTGIYYLESLGNQSINEPILMQGSFQSVSNQYAMIVNEQYHSGIALSFEENKINSFQKDVSAQVYLFSTSNITCNLKRKTLQFNVTINCNNNFSQGIYNITFNLQYIPSKSRGWIYALLILISLLLFYFYYKVQTKSKGYNINLEIEL